MLPILIAIAWLAVAAFVAMLCRAAARSDSETAVVPQPIAPAHLPPGLGLWEDPPELAARDLRGAAPVQPLR